MQPEWKKSAFTILTDKHTGKRPLRKEVDLKEMDINTRNSVDSAQDKDYWRALVNVKLNLQVP